MLHFSAFKSRALGFLWAHLSISCLLTNSSSLSYIARVKLVTAVVSGASSSRSTWIHIFQQLMAPERREKIVVNSKSREWQMLSREQERDQNYLWSQMLDYQPHSPPPPLYLWLFQVISDRAYKVNPGKARKRIQGPASLPVEEIHQYETDTITSDFCHQAVTARKGIILYKWALRREGLCASCSTARIFIANLA